MNDQSTNKVPVWFWIVSVVALLWNSAGVYAYLQQAYMTDEAIAALPEAEQALHTDIPSWLTAAFAIAVFGGFLGCIALLLRKKWAKTILLISLVAIIAQMAYNLFISKAIEVYGTGAAILPIITIAIGVFLVWFAKNAARKGWLR